METANETVAPPSGEGLTFDKVWASLIELRESQKESHQEIDRMLKETVEQMKETDRRMKETDKQI
jgi:hypothetical protein